MTLALVFYRSHNFTFTDYLIISIQIPAALTLYCVICSTHALERVSPRGCVVIFGIFPCKNIFPSSNLYPKWTTEVKQVTIQRRIQARGIPVSLGIKFSYCYERNGHRFK